MRRYLRLLLHTKLLLLLLYVCTYEHTDAMYVVGSDALIEVTNNRA